MSGDRQQRPLQLLSLDGGGVRGLSSLQIIKQLMETIEPDNPPKPCDIFDLIGGTSTGRLIAIMLGRLRMGVDECIDAYSDLSDRIFQKQKHRVTLSGSVQGRFDSQELERAIKQVIQEQGFDVNEPLRDDRNAKCKVFVCAIRKEISHPVHFRSYRYSRGTGTLFNDTRIWEACRATSAATSFFDPIVIGKHKNEFVDGAPGNNNPVRSVFTEAATNWDLEGRLPEHLGCLVSIGTGMPSTKPYGDKFSDIAKTLVKIATESEATATRFAEEYSFLEDNDTYYRFNVMQGLQGVALEDAASKPTIVAATEAYLEGRQVFKRMKACAARLHSHINDNPQDADTSQPSSQEYDVLSQAVNNPQLNDTQKEKLSSEEEGILYDALCKLLNDLEFPQEQSDVSPKVETLDLVPQAIPAQSVKSAPQPSVSVPDPKLSPERDLHSSIFLRNRRKLKASPPVDPFWLNPRFQRWKEEGSSSLIVLRSTYAHRFILKDFCVDAIESIRGTKTPIIWALKVPSDDELNNISTKDVLISLASQALYIIETNHTVSDGYMSIIAGHIQSAESSNDWLHIFGSNLSQIHQAVVIVDIELCPPNKQEKGLSLPAGFVNVLNDLKRLNEAVRVKIILVGYASWSDAELIDEGLEEFLLSIGKGKKHNVAGKQNYRGTSGRAMFSKDKARLSDYLINTDQYH